MKLGSIGMNFITTQLSRLGYIIIYNSYTRLNDILLCTNGANSSVYYIL